MAPKKPGGPRRRRRVASRADAGILRLPKELLVEVMVLAGSAALAYTCRQLRHLLNPTRRENAYIQWRMLEFALFCSVPADQRWGRAVLVACNVGLANTASDISTLARFLKELETGKTSLETPLETSLRRLAPFIGHSIGYRPLEAADKGIRRLLDAPRRLVTMGNVDHLEALANEGVVCPTSILVGLAKNSHGDAFEAIARSWPLSLIDAAPLAILYTIRNDSPSTLGAIIRAMSSSYGASGKDHAARVRLILQGALRAAVSAQVTWAIDALVASNAPVDLALLRRLEALRPGFAPGGRLGHA